MSDQENDIPRQYSTRQETPDIALEREDKKRWNCTIIITVVIEIIILVVVLVLEYFLRFTTIFPVRKKQFSCIDADISYSYAVSKSEYTFNVDVPLEAIYTLDFCIPVAVVLFGEIGICTFASDGQKPLNAFRLKFPQVIRRIVRFIGVFIFGLVSLMIYTDIVKLMTGRLAPNFLEVCKVNTSLCISQSNHGGDELCTQTDDLKLRYARTSFPSMYAAMSTFSAMFVVIYIHGALKTRSVRIFRPFLSFTFLMLAILCGLWEIGTYKCHWTDVVVGYTAGIVLAIYLCLVTLNYFEEYEDDDKLVRFFQELIKEHDEENENSRVHKNRNLQRKNAIYHSPKTNWQRAVSSIQEARRNDPALYNTFQRDLSKGIDYFRDRRHSVIESPAQTS